MEAPQSIEAVGNTIEEAIARGLEALNVERREVNIIVLSTQQDRHARVRLTLKARHERASKRLRLARSRLRQRLKQPHPTTVPLCCVS